MKKPTDQRVPRILGEYHPGSLTTDTGGLHHDNEAPMSERLVVDRQRPVLYDAAGRPICRRVGYR